MKYCKCDNKYMALELSFIIWHRGFFHISMNKQKMRITHCPFCGRKLKHDK